MALSLALLVAACGQKSGVADGDAGVALDRPLVVDPETGALVDARTGEVIDPRTGMPVAPTTTTTTARGADPNERPGRPEATGDAGAAGATMPVRPPSGGVATGVAPRSIKIGMHAPLTGAAPFPNQTVEKGKDLYWEWMERNGESIHGRQVDIVLKDDQLNPSRTVAMCKELVEKERVFMLLGFSGSDQVAACARYASTVGVPYLSGGSTEIGLTELDNYFALWMTYDEIGRLMAQMFVHKLGGRDERNGMLRYATPNEAGAHESFVDTMDALGAEVHYDRAISKRANATDAQVIARELKTAGIDNVYMLVTHIFWVQTAQASANQSYFPQWTGIASVDQLAQVACDRNAIHNARYFNPAPAFVDADRFDPKFRKAGGEDDIQFDLWALSKAIRALLQRPGHNLTRERFIYFTERMQDVETGVLPALAFSPEDHFGGTAMHLNRADCNRRHWVTEHAFVRRFP